MALRPLSTPPADPAWNHAEVAELIGSATRRPAAVLLGIREGVQPRLVFTVRNGQLQAHAGQVAFPGGGSEPVDGGSAVATALRESQEEIGLDPALVTPLGYLDCLETISGYCVTPVVGRIARGRSCILRRRRSPKCSRCRWRFSWTRTTCVVTPWSFVAGNDRWSSSSMADIASGAPPLRSLSICCTGWVTHELAYHLDRCCRHWRRCRRIRC